MKKILSIVFLVCSIFATKLFAQTNIRINIDDDIYQVLDTAQLKGWCNYLPGNKPYTKAVILKAIHEIYDADVELSMDEINVLRAYEEKYKFENDKKNNALHVRLANEENASVPMTFRYDFGWNSEVSGGIYTDKMFNNFAFENIPTFKFQGDISNHLSYMIAAEFDFCKVPLVYMGRYDIGYPWYNEDVKLFYFGSMVEPTHLKRRIGTFRNTSYLPYGYNKRWFGQMYLLTDMSSSGTEGWPVTPGISGNIPAEITGSLFDDKVILSGGRFRRELAGMDNGSSLVLNAKAMPFFGIEAQVELFKYIKYTSLTGSLEYPNQDYKLVKHDENYQTIYSWFPEANTEDAYYFQNNFSVNMIELDFKYFHFDFGSSCIWPKRIELGYLFPLENYVEYQNHIGDFDNLAMFSDIKLRKPGLGEVWGSFYLEELNGLKNNPITNTRDMFAIQAGVKYVVPKLSFATVSARYTKVEPYTYTHHSINYTPWYNHYISENYTNNGEALGYYLDPNSDELKISFEWKPKGNIYMNSNYQFIRHGADHGSQQVPGSSLYSEMRPYNRSDLRKYFLHDGAYNWMHILSFNGSVKFDNKFVPFELYGTAGGIYSYYTMIDAENYTSDGNCDNCNFKTDYHFVSTTEYPVMLGGVLTLGVKLFM